VLLFRNFHTSKHVRQMISQLKHERRGYVLSNCADPERTWQRVDEYHRARHSTNWLTKRYFVMMKAASDDATVNFTLQCIELSLASEEADGEAEHQSVVAGGRVRLHGLASRPELNGTEGTAVEWSAEGGRWVVDVLSAGSAQERLRVKAANLTALPRPPPPLAGEIGFTVGGVYTSLTGWTGERSTSSTGTAQLVLLGLWLERRGYSFWSLGHCYSPQMDYKRQLGHRIYTRREFRELLKKHRGPFKIIPASADGTSTPTVTDSAAAVVSTGAGVPLSPGEVVSEVDLLGLPVLHEA